MSSHLELSDNTLTLVLTEADGTTAVSGATVTTTVYIEGTTTEVTGQTWPATHAESPSGTYSVNLQDVMDVAKDDFIHIQTTADDGANRRRVFNLHVPVVEG